jgi:hypothetical protein
MIFPISNPIFFRPDKFGDLKKESALWADTFSRISIS